MSSNVEDQEYSFDNGSANASLTYPQQASALRKNGFVLIKSHPCKISELSPSKPGKHGHAKVAIKGCDIFTSKVYEDVCPSTRNMDVPNVHKKEMLLLNVTKDGYLSLLNAYTGDTRNDVKVPETEIGEKIKKLFEEKKEVSVVIQSAMGLEIVIDAKEVSD